MTCCACASNKCWPTTLERSDGALVFWKCSTKISSPLKSALKLESMLKLLKQLKIFLRGNWSSRVKSMRIQFVFWEGFRGMEKLEFGFKDFQTLFREIFHLEILLGCKLPSYSRVQQVWSVLLTVQDAWRYTLGEFHLSRGEIKGEVYWTENASWSTDQTGLGLEGSYRDWKAWEGREQNGRSRGEWGVGCSPLNLRLESLFTG